MRTVDCRLWNVACGMWNVQLSVCASNASLWKCCNLYQLEMGTLLTCFRTCHDPLDRGLSWDLALCRTNAIKPLVVAVNALTGWLCTRLPSPPSLLLSPFWVSQLAALASCFCNSLKCGILACGKRRPLCACLPPPHATCYTPHVLLATDLFSIRSGQLDTRWQGKLYLRLRLRLHL